MRLTHCFWRAAASVVALAYSGCSGTVVPAATNASVDTVLPLRDVATQQRAAGGIEAAGFGTVIVNLDYSSIRKEGYAIAAFVKHYAIGTVFLNVPDGDRPLLEKRDPATLANLQAIFDAAAVYMLCGKVWWLDTPTVMPLAARELAQRIGPMYPQFKGIVYDIEPQAYATWRNQRQGTVDRYFSLLGTMLSGPSPATYKTTVIATAPYWDHQPDASGKASPTMLQQAEALPAVDATFLMAYADSPQDQVRDSTMALGEMRKPYWLGATTDRNGSAWGYYGTTKPAFVADMQLLRALISQRNSNLHSVAVNAWNTDANSLQTILPQP